MCIRDSSCCESFSIVPGSYPASRSSTCLLYTSRRNCYGPQEVANFRRQVIEEIVPVNNEIKRRQAKRIGVEDFQVYDNTYFFPDGNPLPHGTPDELMEAGRQMYTEMSPETAEFIQMMFDHDLFDVL